MSLEIDNAVEKLIKAALAEDMPQGDITTDNLRLEDKIGRAKLVAKEDLVLSGIDVFAHTFRVLAPEVQISWLFKNGDFVFKNQTVCTLKGPLAPLLKGERTALNFLGRLSGIATLTRCYADQVKGTKTKILDTRKTTPGMRALEKQAVVHGGGHNHRFSLSAAVLIKENHVRAAGGIEAAVTQLRKMQKGAIELEVRNIEEVREGVRLRVERLLLDNMSDTQIVEALKEIPAPMQTEASGNMHLERVGTVAQLGVDYISVGALTHSAPCADLSLLFE